jgi:hypothetical protein
VGVGWTSIGALSEVWVEGRRGAGSGSDWNSLGRVANWIGPHLFLSGNKTNNVSIFFRYVNLEDHVRIIRIRNIKVIIEYLTSGPVLVRNSYFQT